MKLLGVLLLLVARASASSVKVVEQFVECLDGTPFDKVRARATFGLPWLGVETSTKFADACAAYCADKGFLATSVTASFCNGPGDKCAVHFVGRFSPSRLHVVLSQTAYGKEGLSNCCATFELVGSKIDVAQIMCDTDGALVSGTVDAEKGDGATTNPP
mmetsp:Transcript_12661/g.41482  ORF Transcript_12661/g.41482 Transcript_12661/m.41482 type:complete len:159 (+) Transcript_12661:1935-2411(+)